MMKRENRGIAIVDKEDDQFPEAEKYFESCISLPLFPDLDDEAFHFIIENVLSLLWKRKI